MVDWLQGCGGAVAHVEQVLEKQPHAAQDEGGRELASRSVDVTRQEENALDNGVLAMGMTLSHACSGPGAWLRRGSSGRKTRVHGNGI